MHLSVEHIPTLLLGYKCLIFVFHCPFCVPFILWAVLPDSK